MSIIDTNLVNSIQMNSHPIYHCAKAGVKNGFIPILKKKVKFQEWLNKKDSLTSASKVITTSPRFLLQSSKIRFPSYDQAFMIRRLCKSCYLDTIVVDFNQQYQKFMEEFQKYHQYGQSQDNIFSKAYVVFNKDKRYYTPAFVLGVDLKNYHQKYGEDLEKFQGKKQQALRRILDPANKNTNEGFYVPKPLGHKCQICKQEFEDYMEHTTSEKHLKLFRKSKGWKFMNEFIIEFQEKIALKNRQKIKNKRQQLSSMIEEDHKKQNDQINNKEMPGMKKNKTKLITKTLPKQNIRKKKKQQKNVISFSATHQTISLVETEKLKYKQ